MAIVSTKLSYGTVLVWSSCQAVPLGSKLKLLASTVVGSDASESRQPIRSMSARTLTLILPISPALTSSCASAAVPGPYRHAQSADCGELQNGQRAVHSFGMGREV
jgi:hypothetical protein